VGAKAGRRHNWRFKVKLIKFGAKWCPPCHAMDPILSKFEKAHPDIEVERIDSDKPTPAQAQLAERFHVMSIPTCILLDEKGRRCAQLIGLAALKDLEAALRRARAIDKKRREKPTRKMVEAEEEDPP
jgi:thioredoxin 1